MPSFATETIVIKRINFAEADKILTLYTTRLGKISAIAKGLRRPTSRKSGHLDLLNYAKVFLAEGKNLYIVTQAEVTNSFPQIKADLDKSALAFEACEVINKLTVEGEENKKLFQLLLDFLKTLTDENDLVEFEKKLLSLLGFWSPKLEKQATRQFLKGYIEHIVDTEIRTPKFFEQNS